MLAQPSPWLRDRLSASSASVTTGSRQLRTDPGQDRGSFLLRQSFAGSSDGTAKVSPKVERNGTRNSQHIVCCTSNEVPIAVRADHHKDQKSSSVTKAGLTDGQICGGAAKDQFLSCQRQQGDRQTGGQQHVDLPRQRRGEKQPKVEKTFRLFSSAVLRQFQPQAAIR